MSGMSVEDYKELQELRKLRDSIPELIERAKREALEEDKRQKLVHLHEKRKANPEAYAKRMLERYHKNKEEINKRRRELYKQKKVLETTPSSGL
jgi:hypothetical protein